MEVRLFVSMIVFLHICGTIHGNGVPTVIGQRLIIHNRPCEAHILREQDRYTCNENGETTCKEGWMDEHPKNVSYPCTIPICNPPCTIHGVCRRPQICDCEVGWEGNSCEKCIKRPGCSEHGSCINTFGTNETSDDVMEALACHCTDTSKWTGALCDKAICKTGCQHGKCNRPGECKCKLGWKGSNCDECIKSPGCSNHGTCKENTPFTCECMDPCSWIGRNCDCPRCGIGCNLKNGYCSRPGECICFAGWSGPTCDVCVVQPHCPNHGNCSEPAGCACENTLDGKCKIENNPPKLTTLYRNPKHYMNVECVKLNEMPTPEQCKSMTATTVKPSGKKLDTCEGVICAIPGEKCVDGICVCGDGISCSSHSIQSNGNDWRHYVQGDVWCDASTGSCRCNNTKLDQQTTCSDENKFCTREGCKCSKSRKEYVIEGTGSGTCSLGSDECHNSGPDANLLCDGPCHESTERNYMLDPEHYLRLPTRRDWRKIGRPFNFEIPKHDSEMHGPRWYRFAGKLPDKRVEDESCGTRFPAWIKEDGHPTPDNGVVNRTVCFGKGCGQEKEIQVAACVFGDESFFVYKLSKTIDNDSGYCYEP